MHMRFVRLKIKEEKVWDAKTFYEESVFPQLERTDGCLFAGFLQGTVHGNDTISMTVWTNAEAAAEYVDGGLFDRLLDETDELLQETEEWVTDLPGVGDSVVFSGIEPEVETWDVARPPDEDVLDRIGDRRIFVRMVAVRLRKVAFDEFEQRFETEVQPALAETPGCLGALLIAQADDPSRVLSVTIWAREEDAVRYGLSGEFDRLTLRLKDTFSDLFQWNAAMSSDPVVSSMASGRGLDIQGYHLVIGRKMK